LSFFLVDEFCWENITDWLAVVGESSVYCYRPDERRASWYILHFLIFAWRVASYAQVLAFLRTEIDIEWHDCSSLWMPTAPYCWHTLLWIECTEVWKHRVE
jgi:hypothetical protein